ncbi:methylmalonyl Co-A mutase-associated GTPase MeaB [Dethiobacter alkaliphilus]|uniref:methylmalonyl Co-A mutase-associated GTPase MeaB n=1 Tax=Dethiobacter alkaliphilus TaxID=427926 RepID=UPI0022264C52|nr:methylmalonyl Co-A mutase-associated GTPase MeaB [Dethiobacter alkaliphilus]MCW3489772.1 methylmalonyl Co-A mutase-associated GTPase MeaB [Dethiobacter alkaliphilus]
MHEKVIEGILNGDRRMVARAISLIENQDPNKNKILSEIYPHTGKAYVVGITGAPGAGKSSLVDRYLETLRKQGLTVGVIAVDPTSPFTGGAILGDRIRMQEHALDKDIFIRSMGTRGSLGGLSRATKEAVQVLDAAGKDVIVIETVGVGQSEVDIIKYADSTLVVMTPAGGDSVQTIKAGIMEIADIFIVNKSDLAGADRTVSEIGMMLDLSENNKQWRPPVVRTVTIDSSGIDDMYEAIDKHRTFLMESGNIEKVRKERIRRDVLDLIEYQIKNTVWDQVSGSDEFEELVNQIMSRENDPYSAAAQVLQGVNLDQCKVF